MKDCTTSFLSVSPRESRMGRWCRLNGGCTMTLVPSIDELDVTWLSRHLDLAARANVAVTSVGQGQVANCYRLTIHHDAGTTSVIAKVPSTRRGESLDRGAATPLSARGLVLPTPGDDRSRRERRAATSPSATTATTSSCSWRTSVPRRSSTSSSVSRLGTARAGPRRTRRTATVRRTRAPICTTPRGCAA